MMTEKEFNYSILSLAKHVYSFASNMVGNPDDAADITQDTMIKLWVNRRNLKEVINYKAWALRLTRDLCLDWLKKQKPNDDNEAVICKEGCNNDVLRKIEAKDMAEAIRKIINTLPDNQKEVMILLELEELEYDEISQITGLNENHIRVLLPRGRIKVKKAIGHHIHH